MKQREYILALMTEIRIRPVIKSVLINNGSLLNTKIDIIFNVIIMNG